MVHCIRTFLCLSPVVFCLWSCAQPRIQVPGREPQSPALLARYAVMSDGYELPVTVWKAAGKERAIVLALHGFNDYRRAFTDPGHWFAAHGITTYAYDQRGFGATRQRGFWPGTQVLQDDARRMLGLVCAAHPGVPVFLVGESMGGAVAMVLLAQGAPACLRGVILVAPAVWGWQTMPFWQRTALRLLASIAPAYRPSPRHLDILASDNLEMLRAQGRDPLVIKETRVDTLYGLVDLMEAALLASDRLSMPALILYGEQDAVIPRRPVCRMLGRLPPVPPADWRLVVYPDGYHMLTRDLQAGVVLQDMVAWLLEPQATLPSPYGVGRDGARVTQVLCSDIGD